MEYGHVCRSGILHSRVTLVLRLLIEGLCMVFVRCAEREGDYVVSKLTEVNSASETSLKISGWVCALASTLMIESRPRREEMSTLSGAVKVLIICLRFPSALPSRGGPSPHEGSHVGAIIRAR